MTQPPTMSTSDLESLLQMEPGILKVRLAPAGSRDPVPLCDGTFWLPFPGWDGCAYLHGLTGQGFKGYEAEDGNPDFTIQ